MWSEDLENRRPTEKERLDWYEIMVEVLNAQEI